MIKYKLTILFLFFFLKGFSQPLEEMLQNAAENNPGLQAKYSRFEAEMKKAAQVKGLQDLTFSAGYFISPIETRVGPQRARLSLSQMFPWFGTLKAKEEAATLQAEAEFQLYLDARNQLFFQVKAVYYQLLESKAKEGLIQEQIELMQFFKETSTSKFRNGQGKMADVLRVEIMLEDLEVEKTLVKDKMIPLTIQLNNLLNRPDSAGIALTDSLYIRENEMQMVTDSLSENPKVRYFSLKNKAWDAEEKAADKMGMPGIGVGIDYVFVDKRNDMNVPDNGKNAFMPMVSVSLPIYRGKYKAAREAAQLQQKAAELGTEEMLNSLQSEMAMTRYSMQEKLLRIKQYKSQSQKLKRTYELLLSEYSNTDQSFEEILRIQKQLVAYQLQEIEAKQDYLVAQAKQRYLMGF